MPTLQQVDEYLANLGGPREIADAALKEQATAIADWLVRIEVPFSEQLSSLWRDDDKYPQHELRVLQAMNVLLDKDNPCELFGQSEYDPQCKRLRAAITRIANEIFKSSEENKTQTQNRTQTKWRDEEKALFRVAALYHDIGKCIVRERHPSVGWYMVKYMDPAETENLARLLGGREGYLDLVMLIIRDHDQFGVLSTGEASFPIMLRAIGLPDQTQKERQQIVSALMLCTLADMVGTFPVDKQTVDTLLDDWEWFLSAIDHCSSSNRRLDDYILDEASTTPRVLGRIKRLTIQSSRACPERYQQLMEIDSEGKLRLKIREAFYAVFDTAGAVEEFSYSFTHICKLDYGKQFFEELVKYCHEENRDVDQMLYDIFRILKRISVTYRAMIRSEMGTGNLIGVEMRDLKPRNAQQKAKQMIELMVKSHYPGLTWMMSDAPAWYF